MKLEHPDTKQTVESKNPEAYLSQGWVEVKPKAEKADDK